VINAGTSYVPGTALTTASVVGGTQVYMDFKIGRDSSGNWWITINNSPAGYYPASGFHSPGMAYNATVIDFGGEVDQGIDYPGTMPYRHSKIDMGSGQRATTGWGYAAFHSAAQYGVYNAAHPTYLDWYWASLTPAAPRPGCYDVMMTDPSNSAFYLGGPGYDSVTCPTP